MRGGKETTCVVIDATQILLSDQLVQFKKRLSHLIALIEGFGRHFSQLRIVGPDSGCFFEGSLESGFIAGNGRISGLGEEQPGGIARGINHGDGLCDVEVRRHGAKSRRAV